MRIVGILPSSVAHGGPVAESDLPDADSVCSEGARASRSMLPTRRTMRGLLVRGPIGVERAPAALRLLACRDVDICPRPLFPLPLIILESPAHGVR